MKKMLFIQKIFSNLPLGSHMFNVKTGNQDKLQYKNKFQTPSNQFTETIVLISKTKDKENKISLCLEKFELAIKCLVKYNNYPSTNIQCSQKLNYV